MQIHYKVCTTYMPKNTKKRQCPNPCWMDTHQTNAINVLYVKKIHQNILETLWQWKTTLQPCLRNKQKIFKSAKTLAKKQKECGETHAKKHATCWTLKIPQQQSQTCHGNAAGTKTHTPKKKKGRKKHTNTQNPHQEPCRKGAYEHMVHSRKYQIGCMLNTCIQKL